MAMVTNNNDPLMMVLMRLKNENESLKKENERLNGK